MIEERQGVYSVKVRPESQQDNVKVKGDGPWRMIEGFRVRKHNKSENKCTVGGILP